MAKKIKKEDTVKKDPAPKFAQNSTVKLPGKVFLRGLILVLAIGLIYFLIRFFLVASVNGQLIGRMAIVKELEKQGGKSTLETIILKTLINQEARKRKITVSQKDIDTEIKRIEKNLAAQGGTLDQVLLQQGMKKGDLAEGIKIQLLVSKMAGEDVNVTDKEIEEYLASQKEQSLTDDPTQSAPEITREQAKEAIKQQKLQEKIQTFVTDLKAKAKIDYFINY